MLFKHHQIAGLNVTHFDYSPSRHNVRNFNRMTNIYLKNCLSAISQNAIIYGNHESTFSTSFPKCGLKLVRVLGY